MSENPTSIDLLKKRMIDRLSRRQFFRNVGGVGVGLVGGSLLGAGSIGDALAWEKTDSPTDVEILNFALNLEYLEAQFYHYAVFGTGLTNDMLDGRGTQGSVTGGTQVAFSDPVVAQYAKEIATDELNHVNFLRKALGSAAVAQPGIDIGGSDPNGAFSTAARAAGLVGPGVPFNPYASDENFLLGAYIFEDVGVTAYKGASPLIKNKTYLEAAAGILAAEAYHASLVRTTLYQKGLATPTLRTDTVAISKVRESVDNVGNDDQGIIGATPDIANIAPLDKSGIAYSRTYGEVLNIVYLTKASVSQGGFFPQGVNGTLHLSAAPP